MLCSHDMALRLLAGTSGVDYVPLRRVLARPEPWPQALAAAGVNGVLLDAELRTQLGARPAPDWPAAAASGACRLLLAPGAPGRPK
jgi:hypothetical protein